MAVEDKIMNEQGKGVFEVVKAAILALLISLVLLLGAALIMTFTDISDSVSNIIYQAIRVLSILGGCIFSIKSKNGGWLKGLAAGLIFAVLYFVVYSLIGGEFVFGMPLLIDVLTAAVMGIISGIIAVNIKK